LQSPLLANFQRELGRRRHGNGLEPICCRSKGFSHRLHRGGIAPGEPEPYRCVPCETLHTSWTESSNIAVLDRWAEERTEQLPAIVKELIGSDIAVLVTAGTPATLAAKRASATLPIVFVGVDDPVSLGVVESLGQPGGNVTGLSLTSSEVITERLELLRELVPGLHRLAVIVRDDPGLDQSCRTSAAKRNGRGSRH
jgi:hypothetical protein